MLMHRHLAVLGSPIAHSRSPFIHRAAYTMLGLPWEYQAVDVTEERLAGFLNTRDDTWLGFSVTMPLKGEARRLSAVLDPVATESAVVNTLLRLIDHDGQPSWAGFNTDVAGLAAALEERAFDLSHTLVFGSGATAMSAVMAARMLGASRVSVLARRPEAAAALAEQFSDASHGFACDASSIVDGISQMSDTATSVISTIPGDVQTTMNFEVLPTHVPLFDVAYDPWPSPFAAHWRAGGGVVEPGISMLVHQALLQVRIFVNGDPGMPVHDEGRVLHAMRDAAGVTDLA